ncbi:MAG: hypothetical protein ACREMJ_07590, partial [Gemmatimonadales bacterium]
AEDLVAWMGVPPLDATAVRRSGAEALLALREWSGGVEPVTNPATREPAYGRPAEAQVKWEARHGRPLPDPTGAAG